MASRGTAGMAIDDRYRLVAHIGEGGFGEVWQALNRVGQPVAVKLIKAAKPTEEQRVRLRREGHVSGHLGKLPCFVRSQDAGVCRTHRIHFIQYDLVEGAEELPTRRGPLAARLRLIGQAANCVAEAHRVGVIHRDVKPANFLLGSDGIVRLHDFGLAKILSEAVLERDPETLLFSTRMATGFGTLPYLSPEQLEDAKSVGPATDVFALGATLFEALMEDVWFSGEPVALRRRFYDVEAGRSMVPTVERSSLLLGSPERVRRRLTQLCSEAMSVDPERRTLTAGQFADVLGGVVNELEATQSTPVRARPRPSRSHPSPAERSVPPRDVKRLAPGPTAVLARALTSLDRANLLSAASRLQDSDIDASWDTERIVVDLASYLDTLVYGLTLKDIEKLAKNEGLIVGARKADLFAELACKLSSEYQGFQRVVSEAMTQSLPKAQLLLAARRLEDEDVKPNWALPRIARELVRHPNGIVLAVLTVTDLQTMLAHFGLVQGGVKAELIARAALRLVEQLAPP